MGRIRLSQKIYIGLANTSMGMMGGIVAGSLLKFYTDFLGFPPLLFGIIYLIFAIWNAINDPLIGYISDLKTPKEGKGKRLPFMKRSIPIGLLGFIIIIITRPSWPTIVQFSVLLVGLLIFETAVTLLFINNGALVIGLTDDPVERSSIAMISSYVNIVPSAITGLIPFYFLTGGYSLDFIVMLFLIIACIAGGLMFFSVYQIEEPTKLYRTNKPLNLKKSIKETFKSKAFLCLIFLNFAMAGLAAAFGTAILFYLNYVFGLTEFWAVFPAGVAGILQIPIMPLIIKISKKIKVRNTLIIFMSVMFIGYLGFFFVTNYWLMILCYLCLLTGFSAHGLMSTAAIGDIIDEDELKTGQRREGMFQGVSALFAIPAQGVFILFFTIIITQYGYDSSLGANQTEQAILGIRIGLSLLPMIFLALGILVMFFYPLRGDYYEEMKRKAKELYEKKLRSDNDEVSIVIEDDI